MNITRSQLKTQLERVRSRGWLAHFEEAAETITKGYFDTADLIGIGSRESNLDPKWLTKKGDNGHGAGLMQADDRSFPEFTKGDNWKDARLGILFGAKVLMQKQRDYEQNIGKRTTFKSTNGKKTYSFTGKPASGATAQHIVISGYNCGRWSQYNWANGQDIDKYSTGKDYGRDVMERAAVIRSLLTESATGPVSNQHASVAQGGEPPPLANTADTDPPPSTEVKVTEVHQQDEQHTVATETTVSQPKGDAPEVPPTKVTKNGPISNWLFSGGGVLAIGSAIWGFVQSNLNAVAVGIICLTLLIVVIIFRKALTDAIRMTTAADPDRKNVS